jgi:hypothetical protein
MFEEFKKIPRLFRDCTITEKIDGTNGQILIQNALSCEWSPTGPAWADPLVSIDRPEGRFHIYAGSRNRWVYPTKGQDNSGFAAWVLERVEGLFDVLGEGRHYGEFWGAGIQRRYGLTGNDKRFSLFNTSQWGPVLSGRAAASLPIPEGLGVVPLLYEGPFLTREVEDQIFNLKTFGSRCAPNFMDPEGVVVYHHAAKAYFKTTIKNDEKPKGSTE